MQTLDGWKPYQKALIFWAIFMGMYFLFKFLPVFPLTLICAINESNFQHYKAGFFAYLITNAIEYFIWRRKILVWESYLFSRLTGTIFLPWIIFLLWYTVPAVYGRWDNIVFEIVYANAVTLMVGIVVSVFERGWEQIQYSKLLKTYPTNQKIKR